MVLSYRTGLFGTWLVASLFWVLIAAWAGLSWGSVVGVPLAFGIALCLGSWVIRGFVVKQQPYTHSADLREFRQDLASACAANEPANSAYKTELEPLLDQLGAKYGDRVPMSEIEGLQTLFRTKIAAIGEQEQKIIDRGAGEGKTIEVEALRRHLESSKAEYAGQDRDAYIKEGDRLLESLTAKYGSHIPVDHAYRIMRKLEHGQNDEL